MSQVGQRRPGGSEGGGDTPGDPGAWGQTVSQKREVRARENGLLFAFFFFTIERVFNE